MWVLNAIDWLCFIVEKLFCLSSLLHSSASLLLKALRPNFTWKNSQDFQSINQNYNIETNMAEVKTMKENYVTCTHFFNHPVCFSSKWKTNFSSFICWSFILPIHFWNINEVRSCSFWSPGWLFSACMRRLEAHEALTAGSSITTTTRFHYIDKAAHVVVTACRSTDTLVGQLCSTAQRELIHQSDWLCL